VELHLSRSGGGGGCGCGARSACATFGRWRRMRMGRGGPRTDEAGGADAAAVWGGVHRMGLLADGVDLMI
jgi:hypothetical protein